MALYSVQLKSVSRGKGHSASAAAAYRAGLALDDPTTGERHDYTRRAGVVSVDMLAPDGEVAWAADPTQLWGRVDAFETRANARLAREVVLALPHELDPAARRALAQDVGQWLVDRYGAAVQVAIHAPDRGGDQRNHHAHLLMTSRQVGPEGFGDYAGKVFDARGGLGALELKALRGAIAAITNQALAAAGQAARVDHRTLATQRAEAAGRGDFQGAARLDRLPQEHEGKATTAARRRGERTPRGRRNDRRARANIRRQEAHEARFQQAMGEAQAAGRLAPVDEQAAHARALLERTRQGRARLSQAATQATDSPTCRSPRHGQPQRPRATPLTGDCRYRPGLPPDRHAHGLGALPAVRALHRDSTCRRPGGDAPRPGAVPAGASGVLRAHASRHPGTRGQVQRVRAGGVAPGAARSQHGLNSRAAEIRATFDAARTVAEVIAEILAAARRALAQEAHHASRLTPWQRATARAVLDTHERAEQQARTNRDTQAKENKARSLRRRAEADANHAPEARGRLAAARRAMGLPSAQDQAAAQAREALAKARARVARYKKRGKEGRELLERLQREAEKARAQFAQAFALEVPRFDDTRPLGETIQLTPGPNVRTDVHPEKTNRPTFGQSRPRF